MNIPASNRHVSFGLEQKGFAQEDGIWYAASQIRNTEKERMYLSLRTHEGWIYPDDVVERLPVIDPLEPHADQWKIRKESFDRLLHHLSRSAPGAPVLDLGCGNGWMAGGLARAGFSVCAVDLNDFELRQAARVFAKTSNIQWIYGNIFHDILPLHFFTAIVLGSSVQYFPDLRALFSTLCSLLSDDGEIHIVDTPFYTRDNQREAVNRSQRYYAGIGFPDFASHYYHHTYEELKEHRCEIRLRPHPLLERIKKIAGRSIPRFPWIIVRTP